MLPHSITVSFLSTPRCPKKQPPVNLPNPELATRNQKANPDGTGGGGQVGLVKHLKGCFVDVDQLRVKDFISDQVEQRDAGLGGADRPVGHGGAADVTPSRAKNRS